MVSICFYFQKTYHYAPKKTLRPKGAHRIIQLGKRMSCAVFIQANNARPYSVRHFRAELSAPSHLLALVSASSFQNHAAPAEEGGENLARFSDTTKAPTVALDSYQQTDTNIDKVFSEIWPKKPRKSRPETKVAKSNKEKSGARVSQAITQDGGAPRSETLQSAMALGDSTTEQGIADHTNKIFNLKPGDHVMHSTFGKGEIIKITKDGDDYQITVRFSGKKIRTLSWQYASLTKL